MALDRTYYNTLADETTPGSGTPVDKAMIDAIYDDVDAALAASATPVIFPAVQVPSANVNALDDYEEGTWTPALGGSATYTLQDGTYTKIGRHVFVRGQLVVNAIGTGSTGVISGLPFTAGAVGTGALSFFSNLANNHVFLSCYVAASTTSLTFVGLTAAANGTSNPAVIFGNSTSIIFSIAYHV